MVIRYFFFVLAFALGFYIMLHRDTTDAGVEDDVKNATDYYPFFDDPFLSMVKTTTMFVGEIEFSDIPIEGPMLPLRYFVVLMQSFIRLSVYDFSDALIINCPETVVYKDFVD